MNNWFVSTTFMPDGSSIQEALDLCQKSGITQIELGSNHCYDEHVEDIIARYPFTYLVHNYFPTPKESLVVNIASLNDTIHAQSIAHCERSIDFCQRIGAKLYSFHPGFLSDPDGGRFLSDPDGGHIVANMYDFRWNEGALDALQYDSAFSRMIQSITHLSAYAKERNVKIAIETEGSVQHAGHLLMQKPEEYAVFMQHFSPDAIGITVNLGHLNLASRHFSFEPEHFIDQISEYIVAFEMSHNNGCEDQHLPLVAGAWYWDIISDERLRDVYTICEFRNVSIDGVKDSLALGQQSGCLGAANPKL